MAAAAKQWSLACLEKHQYFQRDGSEILVLLSTWGIVQKGGLISLVARSRWGWSLSSRAREYVKLLLGKLEDMYDFYREGKMRR